MKFSMAGANLEMAGHKIGDDQVVQLSPLVILKVPPSVSLQTKLIAPSSTHVIMKCFFQATSRGDILTKSIQSNHVFVSMNIYIYIKGKSLGQYISPASTLA